MNSEIDSLACADEICDYLSLLQSFHWHSEAAENGDLESMGRWIDNRHKLYDIIA